MNARIVTLFAVLSAAAPASGSGPQIFADCNNNGVEDLLDIQNGTSKDCNFDGIPDECQAFVPPTAVPDGCNSPSECLTLGLVAFFGAQSYFNVLANDVAGTGSLPPSSPETVDPVSQPPQGQHSWDNGAGMLLFSHSSNENDCAEFGIGSYKLVDTFCQESGEATYRFFIQPTNPDCNCNCQLDNNDTSPGTIDWCPITNGTAWDCNEDGVPDADDAGFFYFNDANFNGNNDCQDVVSQSSADLNGNWIPDEAEDPLFTARTELQSADASDFAANQGAAASAVSADGHFTAFVSRSSLVPQANGLLQVALRDRATGTIDLISRSTIGAVANADSEGPSISDDGRYVTFATRATNIVAGNGAGNRQIYRRDRATGSVQLISVSTVGQPANGDSSQPSISHDGATVAFQSVASNLVPGDTNGSPDVFYWSAQTQTVTRASVGSGGVQLNVGGMNPSVSADGSKIAFQSNSPGVVAGDNNNATDVFLYDRVNPLVIRLLSVAAGGGFPNGPSSQPSLSFSGRIAAFQSAATNLVAGDSNGKLDVFVHDWTVGTTVLASVAPSGQPSNGDSFEASLSGSGVRVAFTSLATNLVTGSTGLQAVFLRDMSLLATAQVNRNRASIKSDGTSGSARLSGDGSTVTFTDFGQVMHEGFGPATQGQVYARDYLDRNRTLRLNGTVHASIERRPCQQPLGPFTIEAWVLTETNAVPQTILSKWQDPTSFSPSERAYAVELTAGGAVRFLMSRTDNQEDTSFQEFTAGHVAPGDWHHVACTFDGNVRRIFIDGVLAGEKATSGIPHPARTGLLIGARMFGSTPQQKFAGWMDEVRLWTDARSAVEIQQFMNRRLRRAAVSTYPELVLCHSFESGFEDTRFFNPAFPLGPATFAWMNESPEIEIDCNANGVPDWQEVQANPGLDADGNGILDACQCTPSLYCVGAPNSAGPGSMLTLAGSSSIAANDFAMTATGCPTNVIGIFFLGTQAVQVPFGDGFRCIGGNIGRYGGQSTGSTGTAFQSVNWGLLPGSTPASVGQEFHFQFWYRDTAAGQSGFNLSNAAALTLCL
jgi:Tol biopolymer transport system component